MLPHFNPYSSDQRPHLAKPPEPFSCTESCMKPSHSFSFFCPDLSGVPIFHLEIFKKLFFAGLGKFHVESFTSGTSQNLPPRLCEAEAVTKFWGVQLVAKRLSGPGNPSNAVAWVLALSKKSSGMFFCSLKIWLSAMQHAIFLGGWPEWGSQKARHLWKRPASVVMMHCQAPPHSNIAPRCWTKFRGTLLWSKAKHSIKADLSNPTVAMNADVKTQTSPRHFWLSVSHRNTTLAIMKQR